jgi:hypothetical protein
VVRRSVPESLSSFLSRVVQYQARVYAYGPFLLTDKYPPFMLDDEYAVNVTTNPGRFNRAAVLFRLFLLIPGGIVSYLALIGAGIVGVVGWLLTLIMGRQPTPLFEANAAVLRYQTRFQAFAYMLTAEQPKGLRGDPPGSGPPIAALVDDATPDLPARPVLSRLVLSGAAKSLIVLFFVAAIVGYGGSVVFTVMNATKTAAAYRDLHSSHERLHAATDRFNVAAQNCAVSGGIECLHAADENLARAFDNFADDVQAISFPASIDASQLIADAHGCSSALRRMGAATDPTAYGAALRDYQQSATDFDKDYNELSFSAQYD